MRNMKNPSEIVQQVWEAVCILLGLKGDWNAAKIAMGDANFIQKLIEFDKDNIPEQVMKRVRRYIDNPKFIPDEVGKISRLSSSLCMWVRAIDLYAKIFKVYQSTRYVFIIHFQNILEKSVQSFLFRYIMPGPSSLCTP